MRDLTTRLAVARDNAGPDAPDDLREMRGELKAELARLRTLAAAAGSLEERLDTAEADRDRLADASAAVELEIGTLDATVRARTTELAAVRGLAAADRPFVHQRMQRWLEEGDLASVRDPMAAEGLPADERDAWEGLWAEVRDLRDRTAPQGGQ